MPSNQTTEESASVDRRTRKGGGPCENVEALASDAAAPTALRPPPYVREIPVWARALPPRGRH